MDSLNGARAPEGRDAKSGESSATQIALDAVGAIVGDTKDDADDETGCKQGSVDDEGVAGALCLLGVVVQVCAHGCVRAWGKSIDLGTELQCWGCKFQGEGLWDLQNPFLRAVSEAHTRFRVSGL